jgi:predicted homoserine dehydrogenase-like protein
VAAGKGTKYLPAFHQVTPDDVWSHYGLSPEEARRAGMNPQMFNSFLDGTKSALEMAAVANACDLDVPEDGLLFPPCGVDHLPQVLRPREVGGQLAREGMVEVVSSLERDGRPVFRDLRWGVYVVFKAPNAYAASCFRQYGLITDSTGLYAAMYKPFHLIGLELSISVLHAVLHGQPTGSTVPGAAMWSPWPSAISAPARCLTGRAASPSTASWSGVAQPQGRRTADRPCACVALLRDVRAGEIVRAADANLDETAAPVRIRREMESRGACESS